MYLYNSINLKKLAGWFERATASLIGSYIKLDHTSNWILDQTTMFIYFHSMLWKLFQCFPHPTKSGPKFYEFENSCYINFNILACSVTSKDTYKLYVHVIERSKPPGIRKYKRVDMDAVGRNV